MKIFYYNENFTIKTKESSGNAEDREYIIENQSAEFPLVNEFLNMFYDGKTFLCYIEIFNKTKYNPNETLSENEVFKSEFIENGSILYLCGEKIYLEYDKENIFYLNKNNIKKIPILDENNVIYFDCEELTETNLAANTTNAYFTNISNEIENSLFFFSDLKDETRDFIFEISVEFIEEK